MKTGCCTICLEPLFKDLQVTTCGHVYHRTCIYRWLDRAESCPNCKSDLDASRCTKLFLKPTEMIKEVLHDPTVLEAADPELLLQITAGTFGGSGDDTDGDTDCDVDIGGLDLSKEKKSKKSKCSKSVRMEMVSIKIKNTALQGQVDDLQCKISVFKEEKRKLEDAKSKLNRDVAKYLNAARRNENRYIDIEEKLTENNRVLFKRNKELNAAKKELHNLSQRHAMCAHCEQIEIGNFDAVQQIERDVAIHKSKEEQEGYYRSMYHWILKEYRRSQSDRERDKSEHNRMQKKLGEIHEDQRATIDQMKEMGAANLEKIIKYKKHYYDLKERYLKMKERAKSLQQQNQSLKAVSLHSSQSMNSINSLHSHSGNEHKGPSNSMHSVQSEEDDENDNDHGDGTESEQQTNQILDDDLNSISHGDDQENLAPKLEEEGNDDEQEEEEEDVDLKMMNNHHSNIAMNSNSALNEGVFSIPNDGSMGFRRSGTNALFGAYRHMKHRKDGQSHSFANHPNAGRKRKYSHLTRGSDGRGGTGNFLNQNANAHNQRSKKRRVVKSSTSSNQNKNAKNSKKASIANFFQRNRK